MEETSHKTGFIIFFGVLLVILTMGITTWWVITNDPSTENAEKVAASQTTTLDTNTPYTAEQVAQHDKPANCWTIVQSTVYNLTSVIKTNPGIAELEQSCGKDGTAAIANKTFNTGEKGSDGKAAPQAAKEMLEKVRIGKLKK